MELTGIWNIYKGKGKILKGVQHCMNIRLHQLHHSLLLFLLTLTIKVGKYQY
jgi:hypothetical protein